MITIAMLAALLMPPKLYDHYPRQPFEIIEFDSKLIYAACPIAKGFIVLACVPDGTHKIYIRTDLTPKARLRVLKHEYGHLNGWNHA